MKKISVLFLSFLMAVSLVAPAAKITIAAEEPVETSLPDVDTTGYEVLGSVESVSVNGTVVTLSYSDGNKSQISFLTDSMFRYYVDIEDTEFLKYPKPNKAEHKGKIIAKEEQAFIDESKVAISVSEGDTITIKSGKLQIDVDRATARLTVKRLDGSIVFQEAAPIMHKDGKTVQSIYERSDEYFYGGGTQNGRFSHKGEIIRPYNSNNWVDGGVASPNPFYWTTKGYGVVRNTFKPGDYDFGKTNPGVVSTSHNELRFDAYFMVADDAKGLLNAYTDLTGKPAQQPDYAFYLAHLNCYNRDVWKETGKKTDKLIDGKYYSERQPQSGEIQDGEVRESLMEKNGNIVFTAQRQLEIHEEKDIPLGSFYPNDGYGCGYGQTETFDGDIQELKAFTDFANDRGVETGLWTQANLWPKDLENPQKGERDIQREVQDAGVRAVKTDVAWVGAGYSMALDGVKHGYEAITGLSNSKAMLVSLDGWAGTQRYAGIWSGDQSGGNWEYIRFHIPTYIGTGLSGMPNVGSDLDGIFGGKNPVIQTRDFQWKAFTPYMLDMDGWGASQKNPWEFGEDNTSINRAYLKLKAEMMPYVATISQEASETGMPLVRAMMLEYPDAHTYSKATQYQYMWGDSFLVAPIYQDTAADGAGNDIRNDIYLPDADQIWIDYFTGEQYRGGSVLNNFDAPIWKTPVFVKNGSIVPMYSENNNPRPATTTNPKGLDKSERIVEFYPSGDTSFELYEDDGITVNGASTRTLHTSSVKDDKATLTINKSVGTYPEMATKRSTEMIVNVSAAPRGVTGNVGGSDVAFNVVTSKEAYDQATGNVYFYDEAPESVVSKYATEGSQFNTNPITTRPKVYIKTTDKLDVTAFDYTVVVDGFKNEQDVSPNVELDTLAIPQNLKSTAQTSSTISLAWDKVNEATTYDIEIDGTIFSNFKDAKYVHENLNYDSEYTYRVRSVSKDGFSKWSEPLTVRTSLDPYRNVPKNMTAEWSGNGSYGGTSPADVVDGDDASHFHSKDGGDAYTNTFTIDMQKAYDIEKLEYLPRADFGNGTIKRFQLDYSLDGQNWKKAITVGEDVPAWKYSAEQTMQTLNFGEPIRGRYLRISVKESVGGFFTAHEIRPYAVDGSKGQIVGDWNNSGDIDQGDLTFFENYAGLSNVDSDFGGYVEQSDINFDGKIDAYDISFVARLLNGGVKPSGKNVAGKVFLVPSVDEATAGDNVTYTLYGLGMENVNAVSVEVPYEGAEHEFVSNNNAVMTQFMTSFSKNRTHSNGQLANYLIFTNVGKQQLLNGTGVLGSFTMKQKVTGSTKLDISNGSFVGDNLSVVNALEAQTDPELPITETKLKLNDIASMKFTNDILVSDDGTNGAKLWQQAGYAELLFDGKLGELAEFKWMPTSGDLPDYVKLPTTMSFELKEDHPLSKVRMHNRSKGSNGSVTSASAVAYSGGTQYDLGMINEFKSIYEWAIPEGVTIDRVDITVHSSSGAANGTETGTVQNRMLSIHEIDLISNTGAPVESIKFDEKTPTEIGLGSLREVKASVSPNNAVNPYYNIVSSNPEVANITRVVTETGYQYFVSGQTAGTTTLTATARGDETKSVSMTLTVTNSFDTSLLEEAIAKAEGVAELLYTNESYVALQTALTDAKAALEAKVSVSAIDQATINLNLAYSKLKLKGSNVGQPDSVNLIDSQTLKVESFTSQADEDLAVNVIDKNNDTIWHTSYGATAKLPVDIVINLNGTYELEQLNFLPNTRNRNGDIVRYRVEVSMDGESFTPVVEDTLPYDNSGLVNRTSEKAIKFDKIEARYVKFIALESLGSSSTAAQMNKYASMTEMKLFGIRKEAEIPLTNIDFEDTLQTLNVGDTHTVAYRITPEDTTETLVWTSSDNAVVSVENGILKAHKAGTVTIKAKASKSDVEAVMTVTVSEITLDSLKTLFNEIDAIVKSEDVETQIHASILVKLKDAHGVTKAFLDAVAADATLATPEAVTKEYQDLLEAKGYLEYNQSIKELDDLVNLDLTQYDEGTITTYANLKKDAVKVLNDAIAKRDQVQDMVDLLNTEKANLVALDREDLANVIAQVEALDKSVYTLASKTKLNEALVAAKDVLQNARTNKALSDAASQLETLLTTLERVMTNEQKQAIEAVKTMLDAADLSKFKPESQEVLKEARINVSLFLDGSERKESEAATFLTSLEAIKDLVNNPDGETPEGVDRTALVKAIESARKYNQEDYTEISWNAFRDAYANANTVNANTDATQAQVNDAVARLEGAIKGLVNVDGVTPGQIEGFKGLPTTVAVGDTFTLYPEHDDRDGREGWSYDEAYFAATFNSPATFAALKAGTTEITFTSADGTVQHATVTIVDKKPTEKLPSTGVANTILPAVVGITFLLGGAFVIHRSKKRQNG